MGTVPSYRTWVVGEIVTAAFMNTNIRDSGLFLIGTPFAEVFQAVAQSVANATFTAATFDSTLVDSDGGHSNATNNTRYTGKTPGWFYFSGGASFAGGATGSRATQWAKNGATVTASSIFSFAGTAVTTLSVPARGKMIQLNGTTDFVELQLFQSNGAALLTSVAATDGCTMNVRWVHT